MGVRVPLPLPIKRKKMCRIIAFFDVGFVGCDGIEAMLVDDDATDSTD